MGPRARRALHSARAPGVDRDRTGVRSAGSGFGYERSLRRDGAGADLIKWRPEDGGSPISGRHAAGIASAPAPQPLRLKGRALLRPFPNGGSLRGLGAAAATPAGGGAGIYDRPDLAVSLALGAKLSELLLLAADELHEFLERGTGCLERPRGATAALAAARARCSPARATGAGARC